MLGRLLLARGRRREAEPHLGAFLPAHQADHLGPGGRDATRLAASGPEMWTDLFSETGPRVADLLRQVARELGEEADALDAGSFDRIDEAFRVGGAWRGE